MNKAILFFVLVVLVIGAYAQDTNSEDMIRLTAQQKLKEISVTKLEDSGFWFGIFPGDYGRLELRTIPGGSLQKESIAEEEQTALFEADDNVVGAKVSHFHRGKFGFSIRPIRPLPVEGIVKVVTVWVAGRNTEHELELRVLDQYGNRRVLPMGKLNFYGWKKLSVTIPPTIVQRLPRYNDRAGLFIEGFNINCNIDETYGRFYVYFDDIRAVTDLYAEETRNIDDMTDNW